jgi:hypothetical protein
MLKKSFGDGGGGIAFSNNTRGIAFDREFRCVCHKTLNTLNVSDGQKDRSN